MANLPLYIPLVFIATTFLTIYFLYKAAYNSKIILGFSLLWLGLQGAIGLTGFYTITDTLPPRFALLIVPPFILIALCFATKRGKRLLDSMNTKWLTLLHVVRVPVEVVLLWLFMEKYVPQLMTFEGRNFDILSGLTAPLIFYLGYARKKLSAKVLRTWNFVCLLLLLNIVINAVLSAPFAFQQFAFDRPNIGILYFPFVWLPCFIVPVVLLSHLATIRQLLHRKEQQETITTAGTLPQVIKPGERGPIKSLSV
jgi:hypothetical protein